MSVVVWINSVAYMGSVLTASCTVTGSYQQTADFPVDISALTVAGINDAVRTAAATLAGVPSTSVVVFGGAA